MFITEALSENTLLVDLIHVWFAIQENSDGRIYPSPTSFIQEDHLSLLECVGKILGKAIYEGILMDVPFATFLLNMMCGRRYGSMYSSLDELSSLDPALDKSLRFIKVNYHYHYTIVTCACIYTICIMLKFIRRNFSGSNLPKTLYN